MSPPHQFALAAAAEIAARCDGVVSRSQAFNCGLSGDDIRTLVRRRSWRPLLRGTFFVPEPGSSGELPLRTRARAALVAYPEGVLGLHTAALLLGLQGVPREPRVHLILPPALPRAQARGCRLHWWDLTSDDVIDLDGLRLTSAARTLAELILRVDRLDGLALLDSSLHRATLDLADLDRVEMLMAGRRGVAAARTLLDLVDARSESPLESRVRLRCVDGGVPPDQLQYLVRDRWGVVVARGDLAWVRGRPRPLIGEADGAEVHDQPAAVYRDRLRGNDLTTAQVDLVRFTWADTLRAGYIPSVIRANLAVA